MTKKSSLLESVSVVGSLSHGATAVERLQSARPDQADVIELRLDCYPDAAEPLRHSCPANLPVLVTARCPDEGGRNALSAPAREALLAPFLGRADVFDLEISSLRDLAGLAAAVAESPAILLASFHDFSGTPALEKLESLIATAREAGADAVKFATTVAGPEDLATLTRLFALPNRPPLSVMGMGPYGKISRLLFARLGSVFNYGYLDAPTVPGQWEAGELKRLIALL